MTHLDHPHHHPAHLAAHPVTPPAALLVAQLVRLHLADHQTHPAAQADHLMLPAALEELRRLQADLLVHLLAAMRYSLKRS